MKKIESHVCNDVVIVIMIVYAKACSYVYVLCIWDRNK